MKAKIIIGTLVLSLIITGCISPESLRERMAAGDAQAERMCASILVDQKWPAKSRAEYARNVVGNGSIENVLGYEVNGNSGKNRL